MRPSNPTFLHFVLVSPLLFFYLLRGFRRRDGQNVGMKERKGERKGRNGEWENGVVQKQAAPDIKIYQSDIKKSTASFLYWRRPGRTSFKELLIYFFFRVSEIARHRLFFGDPEIDGRYSGRTKRAVSQDRLNNGAPVNRPSGNIFICISKYAVKGEMALSRGVYYRLRHLCDLLFGVRAHRRSFSGVIFALYHARIY